MASMLGDIKYYQPAPRAWHGAAPIGDRLYMWGGLTEDFSESSRRKVASVVEMYDPYLEAWQQEATTGVPPPGLYAGGCTSVHKSLLWYGGYDGKSNFGTLHQLNTTTLNWEELHRNTPQGPMAKLACGLALFQGGKVGLFGGYGIPTGPTQPGSTFTRNTAYSDGRGRTNEFHLFDLQEGVWSSPPTTGSRPPPCAGFSFSTIDSNRGVLYGGNTAHGKMNDVYIINVQTMHWTKLDKSGGGPWPVRRTSHAACCLNYGEEHPQLLVSGGRDKDDNTLRDLWVLDVEAGTWKELALPEGTQLRCGHTATAFNLSPGVVEVTMFGGCPKFVPGGDDDQLPKIAGTAVVRLESSASGGRGWNVMGVTKGRQLGSPERIREKIEQKTAILVSSELASEKENVRKAESKIIELEEKVESVEKRARTAAARAVRAQIRCDRLEQQLQSTQQLLHTKEEELKALTTQYRATRDKLLHTQEQFSTQLQAHSHLKYTAQQTQEQLQARVRSTQQLLHTKEEELKALTTQAGAHYQAELPVQHTELQKKATGGTELLSPATEDTHAQLKTLQVDKLELEQHLDMKSIENQDQKGLLTTLDIEIQKLQEELAKETFLETTLADEVDILREDLMDREEQLHRFRTQQVHLHGRDEVLGDDYMHTTSGFLRGAEIVAQRVFVISNKAQSYYWEEYGFRLHVPEGSLAAELSECTVSVRVSLSGHFQLPDDSELVSAVYWVSSPHLFSQPLTVDIEHCAAPSMCSGLSFVHTNCTQKKLPYDFKNIKGGIFSELNSYGSISVRHFSGFGVAKKKPARKTKSSVSESESQSENVTYCAQVYAQQGRKHQRFHFVVTKDLKACLTEVKKEFSDSGFTKCLSFPFEFEVDQLSLHLDVPHEGTTIDSEWRLSPLYEPMIKKSQVDHFSSGRLLPKCELRLRWLIQDQPPTDFEHEIKLKGAREHKYFRLFLDTDLFSGSESDALYSPDSVRLKGGAQPTLDSTELFINKYQDGVQSAPELPDLMNEVAAKIPQKWPDVGIQLGMEYDQLKFLSVSNPPGSQQFASVFTAWKNCMRKDYTWAVLIQALKTPAVNEPRLAQELSAKLTI